MKIKSTGNKKGQEVRYINSNDIIRLKEYFRDNNKIIITIAITIFYSFSSFILFVSFFIGLNTGLRISDILNLKFEDINKNRAKIEEIKTGKSKVIYFNKVCMQSIKELKKYYKSKKIKCNSFLFKSSFNPNNSISYSAVIQYLRKAKLDLKIEYEIGTHSLRKTWGYAVYKKTKNIGLLMIAFNHSSPKITLRYIGIEEDDIANIMKNTLL